MQEVNDTPAPQETPGRRTRLHHVYYVLAVFDVLTVLLSLLLFDLLIEIHTESVQVNQQWTTRLEDYSELSRLAVAVNTPGNDVFTSRDVSAESRRLDQALAEFRVRFRAVRDDLSANAPQSRAPELLQACADIDTAMSDLVGEARMIFDHLDQSRPQEAGERMAQMDRNYAKVNTALSALGHQVRDIQRQHLDQQHQEAESLSQWKFLMGGLIVLMVAAVTVYGHKLARRIKEASQQTDLHLAELRRYRGHLEALVNERTEQLRSSHEQLRLNERLASIGTLAAGLGHDMNNVLFPIRCRLDALDDLRVEEPVREQLGEVRRSTDYLQSLADGLRLLALDPEDADASGGATELPSWWREVETLFRTALPKSAQLDRDIKDDVPPVAIAPHRLTQLMFNLVGNAGEALRGAGTVTVTAHEVEDGVCLGVADDGEGMSEEVRRHAMDPFFTTKTRSLSTGLGMAVVQGIVRGAGGDVTIHSRPGEGTRVEVVLPVAGKAEPSRAQGRTAFVSLKDRRTASYMAAVLRSTGMEIRFARPESPCEESLWITDGDPSHLPQARAFLEHSPGNRVVVHGAAEPEWTQLGAQVMGPSASIEALREAIAPDPAVGETS